MPAISKYLPRAALLLFGLCVTATGNTLMVVCGLGADPYNIMAQGLAGRLGTQVGTMNGIIQVVLLLGVLPFAWRRIGAGTALAAVLLGTVMNFFSPLLEPLRVAPFFVRALASLAAPVFVGSGIALVQTANLGMCSNDVVPLAIYERQSRLQYRMLRILYDAVQFVIGFALGGTIGIGTIFSIFLTGPAIQGMLGIIRHCGKRLPDSTPTHAAS